jgi:beta-carotene hydroxylase
VWAIRHARHVRKWVIPESAACLVLLAAAVALVPFTPVFAVYAGLMVLGGWAIPFATSYVPHDPKGTDPLFQTRAFRGWMAAIIGVGHLYHLEHHLYPSVPHRNWRHLARRLDPYLTRAGVRAVRFWF